MIEDVSKTFKTQLDERINSPLASSFALSWAGWNYKVLVVLFSSMSPRAKIWTIDYVLFPSPESVVLYGVCFPLLTALLYIFLYPIPAKQVFIYRRRWQKHLKDIQIKMDGELPLTAAEAKDIKDHALKEISGAETELEKRRQELIDLRQRVVVLEAELVETKRAAAQELAALRPELQVLADANRRLHSELERVSKNGSQEDRGAKRRGQ
jgi:hypothetical protein